MSVLVSKLFKLAVGFRKIRYFNILSTGRLYLAIRYLLTRLISKTELLSSEKKLAIALILVDYLSKILA